MSDPLIGKDCDFILTHPSVNGGNRVGFLLKPDGRRGNTITVSREAYIASDGSYSDRIRFWLPMQLTNDLKNPDGSTHTPNRADTYAFYLAFLAARTGIKLEIASGTYTDLHATLQTGVERLGQDSDDIILSLNNGGFPESIPVDLVRYNSSIWDGPLTWATSYWR